MNNFTFKDIMLVFQKCFNYIDTRLDRHCEQVAFLYWKTLQHTGKYTEEELVTLLSLLYSMILVLIKKKILVNFFIILHQIHICIQSVVLYLLNIFHLYLIYQILSSIITIL